MSNRLVLFDIDKTLLTHGSALGHQEAFGYAFQQVYGVTAQADFIKHNGMTDLSVALMVLTEMGMAKEDITAKFPEFSQVMSDYYLEHCQHQVLETMPGVLPLLKILAEKSIMMGLVTGNLEKIARAKMAQVGAEHYFVVGGFGSDHLERSELVKFAVDRAQRQLGFVNDGQNVFLVGDTPKDVAAGLASGVKTIGVAAGICSVADLQAAGADYVLDSLTEVDRFLEIIK
jgi:phosphoglycolate phosphatase